MTKFLSSERGAVLLEAAIAFPVLIAILLGMVEFGDAYTASRKNAQVPASVADLVSQQTKVTKAQLSGIANIQTTILQPYSASDGGLRVFSVIQNAGSAQVQWQRGWGSLSTAIPSTYSLPSGLITQGSTIIVAEAAYTFAPTIGSYLTGGVTFKSVAYYIPRTSAVTCTDC